MQKKLVISIMIVVIAGLAIFFLYSEYSASPAALFGFSRTCRVNTCSGYRCRGRTIRVARGQPCPEDQCMSNDDCAPQVEEEETDVPKKCRYQGCIGAYCRPKVLNVPADYPCPEDQCTSNDDCRPHDRF